ncbi:polysaccharide deacetylase family protein [Cellulosilyticum ruminicola]|uniref:polysaccharide deacetylase family protein n=1 Tax=Cellulosilyticum ruminicola TaxID=425254 RepID=UPI0006D26278
MKKRKSLIHILVFILCVILSVPSIFTKETQSKAVDERKVLYLTFDDGPSEYTERLLDLLDKHHMKATFFMLKEVWKIILGP